VFLFPEKSRMSGLWILRLLLLISLKSLVNLLKSRIISKGCIRAGKETGEKEGAKEDQEEQAEGKGKKAAPRKKLGV
jgi:hypothetical protein